jgi:hypothetical protein
MPTIKPTAMSKAPPPESAKRAILVPVPALLPFVMGQGEERMICGDCGGLLVRGASISHVVIKCPWCDTYNDYQ